MHFARLVQSAALLLSVIGFALPAHAQNNLPITSGTFYEDRAFNGAAPALNLIVTFAQSPTNKFLNITNVACTIQVDPQQSVAEMNLVVGTSSGAIDLGRSYPIKGNTTPETVGPSKFYSVISNQVFFKMGPGRFPSIQIISASGGSSSITAHCVIVGNLTDN